MLFWFLILSILLILSKMNKASDLGAIFDWDGVIIDSSAAHEQSWELLARAEKRALRRAFQGRVWPQKTSSSSPIF